METIWKILFSKYIWKYLSMTLTLVRDILNMNCIWQIFGFSMAGYVSLFDLGESRDDVEVEYNSLHHYRVKNFFVAPDHTWFCFAHNPQNDSGASTPDTVKPREVKSKFLAFTWAARWISLALKLPPNVSSSFLCKQAVAIYSKLPLSPLPCQKCTSRNTSLTLVLFTNSSLLHTFRS